MVVRNKNWFKYFFLSQLPTINSKLSVRKAVEESKIVKIGFKFCFFIGSYMK